MSEQFMLWCSFGCAGAVVVFMLLAIRSAKKMLVSALFAIAAVLALGACMKLTYKVGATDALGAPLSRSTAELGVEWRIVSKLDNLSDISPDSYFVVVRPRDGGSDDVRLFDVRVPLPGRSFAVVKNAHGIREIRVVPDRPR